MRINMVEKVTGLTQKAIRLYESKGLLSVTREENGYRNYTDADLVTLKKIKLLRSVGISVSDIKLYIFGVLSIEELISKRKSEILKESGINSENFRICESISQNNNFYELENNAIFTENEEIVAQSCGAVSVGIDIGTTTISAVVYDIDNKNQLEAYCLVHNSYVSSEEFSEQSVSVIMEKSEKLLSHITKCYSGITSIGLSGQMHGIVYVDADGNAVSNLINWQDKRGDKILPSGESTCDEIVRKTDVHVATGYGIVTHHYNSRHGLVPKKAICFCSIMDYFGMKLCGLKKPVTHTSVAASFGLFDTKTQAFMLDKISDLGIDSAFLPCVTDKNEIIGHFENIPVAVALGDNQSSFLGSVDNNENSILANVGTGAQISAVSDYCDTPSGIELRPFIDGKYLICGSALCGGSAYEMLEKFFRSFCVSAGMQELSQYKTMNALALEAYQKGEEGLFVDTSFCGKRTDPNRKGEILGVTMQNFTPSALIIGVLKGICAELYGMYADFPVKKTRIVASGGGVQKNIVLQKLLADGFAMPLSVNKTEEEAATGAALFSALACGKVEYKNGFCDYINYD